MYCTDRIYSITDIEFKQHSIFTGFFFLCFVLFSLFLCFYRGTSLLVRPQIWSHINPCFLSAVRNKLLSLEGTKRPTGAFLQSFHGVRSFYAANTILMLHFLLSYFMYNFLWEKHCLSERQVPNPRRCQGEHIPICSPSLQT